MQALGALAAGVVLGGCTGSDADPAEETSPGHAVCAAPADQSQVEACREQGPGTGTVAVGFQEPFDYTERFSDTDAVVEWTVTLMEVECGLTQVPLADSNPEWDGGTEVPQYVDAESDDGYTFCTALWDWENVGKRHGSPRQAGDMHLGDERHARNSVDEYRSWTMMETTLEVDYGAAVNPGETVRSLDLYQVPNGRTLDALYFPMASFMEDSIFLVATTDEPMEPVPTTAPAAAGFKDTDVNELAEDDLATVYQDYEDFGAEESVSRHSAEATLVAVVRLQNSMIFEGEDVPDGINSELVEAGHTVCTSINEGMTLDEIFMATDEGLKADMNWAEDHGAILVLGDFVWSIILAAPDTLCPEHAQVKSDWEQSLH